MNTNKDLSIPTNAFLAKSWGWLLGLGILFIFMGTLGLGMLVGLTYVSMIFFGVLLILGGVSHAFDISRYSDWKTILWRVLIATLYILGGFIVIYDPFVASAIITALLAGMFVMLGTTRIIAAVALRDSSGWGWLLLAGLIAFALGIMILMQWPVSGAWVIGMFIAIEMIVNGWSYVLIALAIRRTTK